MLGKIFTAKALAALAAATVVSGGAAAVATGSLPGPAHDGSSTTLVGLSVPTLDTLATTTTSTTTSTTSTTSTTTSTTSTTSTTTTVAQSTTSTPVGPDVNGPAKFGLCNAYAHNQYSNGKNLESTAFKNLADAATQANQTVEEFCADVTKPNDTPDSSTTTTTVAIGAMTNSGTRAGNGGGHNPNVR